MEHLQEKNQITACIPTVLGIVWTLVVQKKINIIFGFCTIMERRLTRIRNRRYRRLRRLCCERLNLSIFSLPQPLLSASCYCMIYCCNADRFPFHAFPQLGQKSTGQPTHATSILLIPRVVFCFCVALILRPTEK